MENKFNIRIENFKDDDINPDSYLWKFVSIEKFLSIIINEELHLTRLDLFEDKQEAVSLEYLQIQTVQKQQQFTHPLGEFHQIILNGSQQNKLKAEQLLIQKSNFANCWYIGDGNIENVAMWNLYSSYNSVALKIKYKDFKKQILNNGVENKLDEFEKISFSKVKYVDFNTPNFKSFSTIDPVLIKDKSFEYEKEFRIVAYKKYSSPPPPNKDKDWIPEEHYEKLYNILDSKSIKLKLTNFKEYPFIVTFHPKCPDWIQNDILKIMRKMGIKFPTSKSILQLR